MNNYMYILECSDGSLYTGWTNDLAKRVKAHNIGQAMRREAQVKRLTRAEKMKLITNGNEDSRKG